MLGSLIGIFLTSAGIVIGADSAVSDSGWIGATRAEKVCKLSPRSVAVMQGWYGEQLHLARRFHKICAELSRSSKRITLDRQADRLIGKLEQAYREHIGPLPPNMANLPSPSTQHVMYVTVAGFDRDIPLSTVRELRWVKNRKGGWRLTTEHNPYLSVQQCGVRFIGENTIANMLLEDREYFDKERGRPEVLAGRQVNLLSEPDTCRSPMWSVQVARDLYVLAVRMTIDHAHEFLLDSSEVGGRLHLFTIRPSGAIEEAVIEPEQYVGDDTTLEILFVESMHASGHPSEN